MTALAADSSAVREHLTHLHSVFESINTIESIHGRQGGILPGDLCEAQYLVSPTLQMCARVSDPSVRDLPMAF